MAFLDKDGLTYLWSKIKSLIPNNSNLVNGSASGSLRSVKSANEVNGYTIGRFSYAEGYETKASGDTSHAEGYFTIANGQYSHAEGDGTEANGPGGAHAEGDNTVAKGRAAHAEGGATSAIGWYSHAEGFTAEANKYYSHAEGYYTIAGADSQHVQGRYNIKDSDNTYAHIVGNGTSEDNRSNAHTLDWGGNAWFAGKISQDGTPTEANDLATKSYVDSVIPDTSEIPNNSNIVNGSAEGSLRSVNSAAEDGIYTIGIDAIAEGYGTEANGRAAHAEGVHTNASGIGSHAEGDSTNASGVDSHAEGDSTNASGDYSHAEGSGTQANGQASHAEGRYTIAASILQHVQGRFNIEDSNNTYAHIVGNGTHVDNRSNAHTLDWAGNAWFAGKLTVGPSNKELAQADLSNVTADTIKTAVENAGFNGVFVAEYGTTTFSEIIAAKDSGKLVIAKRQIVNVSYKVEVFAILIQVSNVNITNPYSAYFIYSNGNGQEQWTVDHDNTWSSSEIVFLSKIGGTMTGQLIANNNTSYITSQVRNISLQTTVPTSIANGAIVGVYSI